MIDVKQWHIRKIWFFVLLSPVLGMASYVLGSLYADIVYGRYSAQWLNISVLVISPATLLTGLTLEYRPSHEVTLLEHAWLAVINSSVYLVFCVVYGLGQEGRRFFRILFRVLLTVWVLFWMKIAS